MLTWYVGDIAVQGRRRDATTADLEAMIVISATTGTVVAQLSQEIFSFVRAMPKKGMGRHACY